MMKVLVTGVKPWSMVDKDTGEVRSGSTVEYFDIDQVERSTRFEGMEAYKSGCPAEVTLDKVPGLYEFEMAPKRNQKGRMEMALNKARLLAPVDFSAMVKETAGTAKKAS